MLDLVFLLFFKELLRINLILATALSFIFVTFINYYLNIKLIFINGKFIPAKEIFLFYFFALLGLIYNILMMNLLTNFFHIWYVNSKILISLSLAAINFSIRKWFLFIK